MKTATLGPWIAETERKGGAIQIIGDAKQLVALVYSDTLAGQKANAELIASAPDLLELSKELLTAMEQKQFVSVGFTTGGATLSEFREASQAEHNAYSNLWNFIHKQNETTI